MKLIFNTQVAKSEKELMNIGSRRLMERITNYDYEEIRRMRVDDYLIHKKFIIHGNCFIIYKTVVIKQQLRILCYVSEDEIVIIAFCVKKKSKSKYYEDFKLQANRYCKDVLL